MEKGLLNVREVAAAIGMSERFTYRELRCGKLAHHRIGGRIRVAREQLAKYLNDRQA